MSESSEEKQPEQVAVTALRITAVGMRGLYQAAILQEGPDKDKIVRVLNLSEADQNVPRLQVGFLCMGIHQKDRYAVVVDTRKK